MAKLAIKAADFEGVYGWLEAHTDVIVDVWGLEFDRPAALLAYRSDAEDGFDWSNWVRAIYDDPSEILGRFERLGVALEDAAAAELRSALPQVVSDAPAAAAG